MTAPDSDPPISPPASPLFSLPRIPYFFTITPYPLSTVATAALSLPSCHSAQQQSLLRMKRRHNSSDSGYRGLHYPADHVNDTEIPTYARHGGYNRQQQIQPDGQEEYIEPIEPGADNIEGRVLKKMRGIKLDSESPPLDNVDTPNQQISGKYQQQSDVSRMIKVFGPIKISTRASAAKPPESLSQTNIIEPAAYSDMNSLLHQMHAARFGIPSDLSEDSGPPLDPTQEQQQVYQQDQQNQYESQHRLPTSRTSFASNTTWNQTHRFVPVSRQAIEEDDEMVDVQEISQQNNDFQQLPTQYVQQGYMLEDQYHHLAQPSSQQRPQDEHINNSSVYQNINAQLRAAFLARAERYR
ncbi:hypothetical protein BCR41DRAFT_396763 [Lobosporangium transversale]|uniref:Uncharacterized protein n=1 Tax=Lobosporangium transversale TaxID=64571 RepID=A0A1Y2GMD1_9FUNG|nr:hypothetical protein BCR41DRAFT_396763 [Lobosporangium transversale]ORZ14267.1 hypothetical protein BCR41DRAFT_396763 [Lobosporangium transversale]|eukprot:XP_021880745.1 hypothetical protein BCR41DRAFT_396763 [Lobosporangium transversale]